MYCTKLIHLTGGLYGSSYLNEKFRKYIRDLLSTETYLEDDGDTLDSIADTMTVDEFEYRCKRNHDIYNPGSYPRNFPCHGLRENLTNSTFRRNRLRIKK